MSALALAELASTVDARNVRAHHAAFLSARDAAYIWNDCAGRVRHAIALIEASNSCTVAIGSTLAQVAACFDVLRESNSRLTASDFAGRIRTDLTVAPGATWQSIVLALPSLLHSPIESNANADPLDADIYPQW
jgi:hypothetical protein